MIKAHETQLELRLPRIGTIRKGAPKPEKGPGKDLEYFRLDRADPGVAEAWHKVLGREPKSISGILPYSDPAENLSIWDELWQGKRLLWRGDGERLHVKLDGSAYVRYAPGSGPPQPAAAGQMVSKLKVARVSRLRLLLPQLGAAGIFEVMSSSAIDADELWANLMWIRSIVATLQGAPVTVFRAGRQFNVAQPDGKTMVVTKHMLHLMLDGRSIAALLPAPSSPAPLLLTGAPPALTSGPDMGDDAPEDGEYEDDAPPAPQPPAPAMNGNGDPGPLADDELIISEAAGRDFLNVAAKQLGTDAETIKARLHALGYTAIPGKAAGKVDAYRKLKTAAQQPAQADWLDAANDEAAQRAALATAQGEID